MTSVQKMRSLRPDIVNFERRILCQRALNGERALLNVRIQRIVGLDHREKRQGRGWERSQSGETREQVVRQLVRSRVRGGLESYGWRKDRYRPSCQSRAPRTSPRRLRNRRESPSYLPSGKQIQTAERRASSSRGGEHSSRNTSESSSHHPSQLRRPLRSFPESCPRSTGRPACSACRARRNGSALHKLRHDNPSADLRFNVSLWVTFKSSCA